MVVSIHPVSYPIQGRGGPEPIPAATGARQGTLQHGASTHCRAHASFSFENEMCHQLIILSTQHTHQQSLSEPPSNKN